MTDGRAIPAIRQPAVAWAQALPAVVVMVAVLTPLALVLLGFLSGPDDGSGLPMTRYAVTTLPSGASGVKVLTSNAQNGLRAGDLVVAIDSSPVQAWPATAGTGPQLGDRLTYTVVRDGRQIDLPVQLHRPSLWQRLRAGWKVFVVPGVLLPVGAYVFLHRPRVRAAQLVLACGAFMFAGTVSSPVGPRLVDLYGGDRMIIFALGELGNCLLWSALLHFVLVFPEPGKIIKRFPALLSMVYLAPLISYGVDVLRQWPSTHALVERQLLLVSISRVPGIYMPALIVVGVLDAYRRSPDPESRRRMRWVIITLAGSSAVWVVLGAVPDAITGSPLVPYDWLEFAFVSSPIAVGAAVLTNQLFDLTVVVRRWLVSLAVVAPLAVAVIIMLALLGRRFDPTLVLVAAIATATGALIVRPAYESLRRLALHMLYGARTEPYEFASQLARLSDETDSEVLDQLCADLISTLRLSYIAVELPDDRGHIRVAASAGARTGPAQLVALTHRSRAIGQLTLAVSPGREPFGRADARLLHDLGTHIARVVEMTRLNDELQRSRSEIISAREEERRLLQRELHDGIGPSLAAQAMQIDVARYLIGADAAQADAVLGQMADRTQAVIGEVRRVVEGLRPLPLDQLGLVTAIRQQARAFSGAATSGVRGIAAPEVFVTTVGDLDHLPAAVEVAVYRVATEALTNVVRHSRATSCELTLAATEGVVVVTVEDNGIGIPQEYRPGVGLASMRQRATELGGSFRVDSSSGGGSRLVAEFPVGTGASTP